MPETDVEILATHHGRGRSSGAPVDQLTAYLYTVRDGKITRIEAWPDKATAFEAAGLPE